ncbi:MAG: hypothetical protein J0I47_00455 [Sphingomonas sp.]|uniref:hypothetical protein n=1 Tax=Sphingomonas sp. TaxID=28214 RepID=UPI001AC25B0E|nr:hypothetical protein [Sphingomonas sp.]MBN8806699.1 hypothetical protein [Sphingomonas sp.]
MLRVLPIVALATATPVFAQEKPADTSGNTVVVTGVRLHDLQKNLDACLARKCPPNEDISATIKVAEQQFVDGKYADASVTLRKSLGRNRGFAKDYPVSVSYLYRASYRVAEHLGDADTYITGVYGSLRSLKAGLAADDYRILGADLEVGDMLVRFYRYHEAIDRYTLVEKRAAALGLLTVQGLARFRIVGLYSQLASHPPYRYKTEAKKAAAWLIDNPDPRMKPFGEAARITIAMLDAKTGDPGAVDRLIANFRTDKSVKAPILLYAPPYDYIEGDARASSGGTVSDMELVARQNFDGEWVDIDFWVGPDGHVSDVDVLRAGKKGTPTWIAPIIKSIRGRRYAPLNMDASAPGVLRVERYTLTARVVDASIGSHIPSREATPQIETLDLSVDPTAAPDGSTKLQKAKQ